MGNYLKTLNRLTQEFLASEDKDNIQHIEIQLDDDRVPFKMFMIADSKRLLIPTRIPFELVIFISFTWLTPLGKKTEELMSKSEALKNFEHTLEGKTSSYFLRTGNNVEVIVTSIQGIIEKIFPYLDKNQVNIAISQPTGIIGYADDSAITASPNPPSSP